MSNFLNTPLEYVKGIGPQKAEVLKKELGLHTLEHLLEHYPFRYDDRSKFCKLAEISPESDFVQFKIRLRSSEILGEGRRKRLVISACDETGHVELLWFQGIKWIQPKLKMGDEYIVFGKPQFFKGRLSISHPDLTPIKEAKDSTEFTGHSPVYNSSELMKKNFLDSKGLSKIIKTALTSPFYKIDETLSVDIMNKFRLISRHSAVEKIHFPKSDSELIDAKRRLKFEELFFIQLGLIKQKLIKKRQNPGFTFSKIPLVSEFYKNHLEFELTDAQKRVIKEIRRDLMNGRQMNRLLQGDVGSGKTIVAFICTLMAIDNGHQATIMAPTEILAEQHYNGLVTYAEKLGIKIALLTGSTKTAKRKELLGALFDGALNIIIGTHALLEDRVKFNSLGICIIDEQHRFGVAQRGRLWRKNKNIKPHMLVMTATPIPRTLAMTLYGDLDVSVIDELPAGRKPVITRHTYEKNRLQVFGFINAEIEKERQAYIIYPLIEESNKLDLKDLMDGYESVCRAFPNYRISIVHGKMKPEDKEFEMQRFANNETQILVATTVIEVGINVPNATVMLIENAERFGLSQLHQLRGRVGRSGEQSYCILNSKHELSRDGRTRLKTMVSTNNGFEIADVDLKLRGPGDLAGTKQSGVLDLKISDLSTDAQILSIAREEAVNLLEEDPFLEKPSNYPIKIKMNNRKNYAMNWSEIS